MSIYSKTAISLGPKKAKNMKVTSVTSKIPGFEANMVANNDGGYGFKIKPEDLMDRFLVLGTEGMTLNISEKKLTFQNVKNLQQILLNDPKMYFEKLEEVSLGGKALKQEPVLFALALATTSSDVNIREYAFQLIPSIARTGTMLFTFMEYMTSMRNWSRMARSGVANWYTSKKPESVIYQMLKYQSRVVTEGDATSKWTHADVIRLAHVKFDDKLLNLVVKDLLHPSKETDENIFHYCVANSNDPAIKQLVGFKAIREGKLEPKNVAKLIDKFNLTREMVPTEYLNIPEVQEALLQKMPYIATMRNLAGMTASGLIKPFSNAEKLVCTRLLDIASRKPTDRAHPMQLLHALRTYAQGQGMKGNLTWSPTQKVSEALEAAFFDSFNYVQPSGKNFYIGIDVSASMTGNIQGQNITSSEYAAVIGLTLAKCEPNCYVKGFANKLVDLKFSKHDDLLSVMKRIKALSTGSTNAGAPIDDAIRNKYPVDVFAHVTDGDFNTGKHPYTLLREFRRKVNPDAKMVMMATYSSTLSSFPNIPEEEGRCLNIAGFSVDAPKILQAFAGGKGSVDSDE